MRYEELKQSIDSRFIDKGFQREGDVLKLIHHQHQQLVINGTPHDQVQTIEVKLMCLGEGALEDQPIVGYKLIVQDQDRGDFWLSDVKDLDKFNI